MKKKASLLVISLVLINLNAFCQKSEISAPNTGNLPIPGAQMKMERTI